jgi:protein-tyrosine phosphatase
VVRADAVDRLTADGWAALRAHGVRTVIDLRNEDERAPDVDVVGAVRSARPGGVVIHCVGGRDRTGLVTMVLLALAGVAPGAIADDHALSTERLARLYTESGEPDQGAIIEEFLEREGTTARELILTALASLDVDAYLRQAGLSEADLSTVRDRLLA